MQDEVIFGEPIENYVAKCLIDNNLTIACAESCTGGLLAGRLINYPGISSVFMEGMVTYSNASKHKRLGVKEETLDKYGAVSRQTAVEMAAGVAKAAETNIGIATTGIAGPGGGSVDKPVGLVYIGIYINGKASCIGVRLKGNRQAVRNKAVLFALELLKKELLKNGFKEGQ